MYTGYSAIVLINKPIPMFLIQSETILIYYILLLYEVKWIVFWVRANALTLWHQMCPTYRPRITQKYGGVVFDVILRSLSCCDCGFESHRGHGCLSLVSVASSYSLVQRSPTECGVYLSVIGNLDSRKTLVHRGLSRHLMEQWCS